MGDDIKQLVGKETVEGLWDPQERWTSGEGRLQQESFCRVRRETGELDVEGEWLGLSVSLACSAAVF